jgi:hypothetical protein
MQRLRFTGAVFCGVSNGNVSAWLRMGDVVHEGTYGYALFGPNKGFFGCSYIDLNNIPNTVNTTINKRGVVYRGTYTNAVMLQESASVVIGDSCVMQKTISAVSGSIVRIRKSSYVRDVVCSDGSVELTYSTSPSTGLDAIIKGGSGVGVTAINSTVKLLSAGTVTIGDHGSHGIELDNSRLQISSASAVLSGTGNGGVGIYAHSGSKVSYPAGSAPTITGTVGDIAITDPATEDLTWAELDAAGKAVIASEDVILKKV